MRRCGLATEKARASLTRILLAALLTAPASCNASDETGADLRTTAEPSVPESSTVTETPWAVAESRIVRLPPAAFPDLPADAAAALASLGCAIPQAWGSAGPHNVVSGTFATADQTDWAALCSVEGLSAIVILWGGSETCPTPITPPMRDGRFLQNTGVDGIMFSRGISAIRPDLRFWSVPAGFPTDSLTHDAISDAFFEKGATAYYCHRGAWLEFGGGD